MKLIVAAAVATLGICAVGDSQEDALRIARASGAAAKIILCCVDQDGCAVSNANVSAGLYPDGSFKHAIAFNGLTDTNGVFVAEGKTNGEYTYEVTKAGSYRTFEQKFLFKLPSVSVSNGRWQPYGMTNTVVLKRKVNPVALIIASYLKGHHLIPEVGVPFGFDLKSNDWVIPHGKGKVADFMVTFLWDGSKFSKYTGSDLIISFTNRYAGVYKVPCDSFSEFKSPYRADTNAVFMTELKFSLRRMGGLKDGQLKEDECLILRVRPRLDKDGNLAGAHYAKIYGPWRFGFGDTTPGSMSMSCYFNPNENDPNLEADTTINLLNPHDLGFPP